MKLYILFELIKKIGFYNVFILIRYKLFKFIGIYQYRSKIVECPNFKFKEIKEGNENLYDEKIVKYADAILENRFKLFSHYSFHFTDDNLWNIDPFSKKIISNQPHWSKIQIYKDLDIKNVWEMSRWTWMPILSMAFRMTGDIKYLKKIEFFISNWGKNNPINSGINWVCGQEISIRLMHLFQSIKILYPLEEIKLNINQSKFVFLHLKRIFLTLDYAIAQQNNHIISESAALYIGGNLIGNYKFAECGRDYLEKYIDKLVMNDGSFSQHSVVYHRLVLDTLCQIEIWRRTLNLNPFSNNFYRLCNKLIFWLFEFTDKSTGKCPNLGGNDGAYCYQYNVDAYRDFRPTLNLASYLFRSTIIFRKKNLIYGIKFTKLSFSNNFLKKENILQSEFGFKYFKYGGYLKFFNKYTWAILRLPIYNFRPANVDPLHFDLWHKGKNIIRDSGTYSYNKNILEMDSFQGIAGHSSVQFDDKENMPRLSRFLWGNWLKLESINMSLDDPNLVDIESGYKFKSGSHFRRIICNKNNSNWEIVDYVLDFNEKAILRWRLIDDNWTLENNILKSRFADIKISCSHKKINLTLGKGYESLFYNQKKAVSILKVLIFSPGKIKTTIKLN